MSRNYRKEYDSYHSRPEQKIRRAARNAARARFKDADPNKDVHHKDNNPLNNDRNNLSLVTQHYNRREPRLRGEAFPSGVGMTAVVVKGKIVAKGSKKDMRLKYRELMKHHMKHSAARKDIKLVSAPGSKYKVGDVWKEEVKLDEWTISDVEIAMKKKYGKIDKAAIEKLKKVQHLGNVDRNALVKVGHGKLHVEYVKKEDNASRSKEIRDLKVKHRDEIEKERAARVKEIEARKKQMQAATREEKEIDESPIVVANEVEAVGTISRKFEELLRKANFSKKQKLAKAVGIKVSLRGKHRVQVEANALNLSNPDAKKMVHLMQKYFSTTSTSAKRYLMQDINKLQKKLGLKVTEAFKKQKPYASSTKGHWSVLDADGKTVKSFGRNKDAALSYLKRNFKKLSEDVSRKELQKYYDKQTGTLRQKITKTEKKFKIKKLRVSGGIVMRSKNEDVKPGYIIRPTEGQLTAISKMLDKKWSISKIAKEMGLPVKSIKTIVNKLIDKEDVQERTKELGQLPPIGLNHPDARKLRKMMQLYFQTKNPKLKTGLLKNINKLQLRFGIRQTEDTEVDETKYTATYSLSSSDARKVIDLMHQYTNTPPMYAEKKAKILKDINKFQKKLGLKLTAEDMGTVTGTHIAGTGDDSSTVLVKKKKKQKKDIQIRFKLKNQKSLRKRILDNVLALQQKV